MENQIISLSGGKDSTAMLLMMIEKKELIHSIVFFDTGWEFPQMYRHIDLLERSIGFKIYRLHPRIPFDWLMTQKPLFDKKSKTLHYGYGWPKFNCRWCTGEKKDTLAIFSKYIKKAMNKAGYNIVENIGFAADETKRIRKNKKFRYPLLEYGMSENDCLKYCISKGYEWEGLYDHFDRVSCFCCPFKKISELRLLKMFYPKLWDIMIEMDKAVTYKTGKFRQNKTVVDFDKRFECESKQMCLW